MDQYCTKQYIVLKKKQVNTFLLLCATIILESPGDLMKSCSATAIFTACQRSCGKVMFSRVFVHRARGVGRGKQKVHLNRQKSPNTTKEKWSNADGTHPIEMHSCSLKICGFYFNWLIIVMLVTRLWFPIKERSLENTVWCRSKMWNIFETALSFITCLWVY